MDPTKPIVVFEHVSKSFGNRRILNDITFTLHDKEIFGLIGPSGAGKTTILRTLIGFYPSDFGRVMYEGKQVTDVSDLTRQIGFATQDECFYEDLSCEENMKYFGTLYGIGKVDLDDRIKTLLGIVELENARHLLGRQLSGGMRRRLDVAIALLHSPKILILDEPTSGLDPVLRKHMLALIERIRDNGISIIITSHILEELEQVCDNVAIIFNGRFVALGTPADITKQYFPYDEIHLVTYPGDYQRIVESVRAQGVVIAAVSIEDHQVRISTSEPERAVYAILRSIAGMGEHLIDLDIMKPTLGEVFEKLETEAPRAP
jgi:ABC-2 type transport system ATP-binding protein